MRKWKNLNVTLLQSYKVTFEWKKTVINRLCHSELAQFSFLPDINKCFLKKKQEIEAYIGFYLYFCIVQAYLSLRQLADEEIIYIFRP